MASGRLGGIPIGGSVAIPNAAGTEVRRGLTRENESAKLLAEKGFRVDQSRIILPNGKEPDLTIEGRVFDVLSPKSDNLNQILKDFKNKTLGQKVGGVRSKPQTRNLVVNLNDTSVSPSVIQDFILNRSSSLPTLNEVIIIPKNSTDLVRFDLFR